MARGAVPSGPKVRLEAGGRSAASLPTPTRRGRSIFRSARFRLQCPAHGGPAIVWKRHSLDN